MIAGALASVNFFFGLRVGHSGVDTLEDLALRQAGIDEPRNLGAGHNRQAIQMALKNELHSGIGEADELESDSVDADGVELVGVGDVEDLLFRKTGAGQIGSGFRADEKMFANMGSADQVDASVIAEASVLQFDDLGDFRVRDIEPFQLLDVAGEHPRLVQRTIVREGMLMAACR